MSTTPTAPFLLKALTFFAVVCASAAAWADPVDRVPCFPERLVVRPSFMFDEYGQKIGFVNPGKMVRILRRKVGFEPSAVDPPTCRFPEEGGAWVEVEVEVRDSYRLVARIMGWNLAANYKFPNGSRTRSTMDEAVGQDRVISEAGDRSRPGTEVACSDLERPLKDDLRSLREWASGCDDGKVPLPKGEVNRKMIVEDRDTVRYDDPGTTPPRRYGRGAGSLCGRVPPKEGELGVPGRRLKVPHVKLRSQPSGHIFTELPTSLPFRVLERYGDQVLLMARTPGPLFDNTLVEVRGWVSLSDLESMPDLGPQRPVVTGRVLLPADAKGLDLASFRAYVPSPYVRPRYEAPVGRDGSFVVAAGPPVVAQVGALDVPVEVWSPDKTWAGFVESAPALFAGGGPPVEVRIGKTYKLKGEAKTPAGARVPHVPVYLDGDEVADVTDDEGLFAIDLITGQNHWATVAGVGGRLGFQLEAGNTRPRTRLLTLRTAFPLPVFGSLPLSRAGCQFEEVRFLFEKFSQRTWGAPLELAAGEEQRVEVSHDCLFTLDRLPATMGSGYDFEARGRHSRSLRFGKAGPEAIEGHVEEVETAHGNPRPICLDAKGPACRAWRMASLVMSVVDANGVLLQEPATVSVVAAEGTVVSCVIVRGQCAIHNLAAEADYSVEVRLNRLSKGTTSAHTVAGVREVVLRTGTPK